MARGRSTRRRAATRGGRPRRRGAAGKRGAPEDPASFYASVLELLNGTDIPFLLGGSHAVGVYTDVPPRTKDLDVFCRAGDYPRILSAAAAAGYETEVEDERWIAKIRRGDYYCDVIFGSANALAPVTDSWFREERFGTVCGVRTRLVPPSETIWSKAFIMDRGRFDGNVIAQLILRERDAIDWRRVLGYMEQHWEVLLQHVLRFRYIYPSERDAIPAWLLDELLSRLAGQRQMPLPRKRACRGRLFSRDDFLIDITVWGFADAIGESGPENGEKAR